MKIVSRDNVFLFAYRGQVAKLKNLVSISGRKELDLQDGVKHLADIVVDAKKNHGVCSIIIPKKLIIQFKGKQNFFSHCLNW